MDQSNVFPLGRDGRRQTMRTPDEVAAMQRLHGLALQLRFERSSESMGDHDSGHDELRCFG